MRRFKGALRVRSVRAADETGRWSVSSDERTSASEGRRVGDGAMSPGFECGAADGITVPASGAKERTRGGRRAGVGWRSAADSLRILAMTIPIDPLHRWWIEVSADNRKLVEEFRPSLIGFMAFDRGRRARFHGTGFFIAANPELAIALTAKHVLVEGVARHQRPVPAHAPSALFIPANSSRPSVDPIKLKAMWMGTQFAGML